MDVPIDLAANIVDEFENVLMDYGISIPENDQTKADMLPLWQILKYLRTNQQMSFNDQRALFIAGCAMHDLASKVLEVKNNPHFDLLIPHLTLLAQGAIHLTEPPPNLADTYNKLIEVYWACLCLGKGLSISLDDPKHSSRGVNPDVITLDQDNKPIHAYAFKTIRSQHTQNIYDHIVKGVQQIERSPAKDGIVALHLTPRLDMSILWPEGYYFNDWRYPASYISGLMRAMIGQVVSDNGMPNIEKIFSGKKAVPAVLCIAFAPTVASHPTTGKPTFMPLKVPTIVEFLPDWRKSDEFLSELTDINDGMQTFLG